MLRNTANLSEALVKGVGNNDNRNERSAAERWWVMAKAALRSLQAALRT